MDGDKENSKGGCPSKLSSGDKRSIIRQITSGRLDNAVEATHFINNILPILSHPKQSGMHSKEMIFKPLSRRNALFSRRPTEWLVSNLPDTMKTGQWRIGKGSCGQMRPKLTGLGQMERFILGKKGRTTF
jgi:hypothetical protein